MRTNFVFRRWNTKRETSAVGAEETFDTVQMPLNCLDATFRSFETNVLPEARKQGVAVLGMKSMDGSGEIIIHGAATPDEALRYAMSLPWPRPLAEWTPWTFYSRTSPSPVVFNP